MCANLKKKKNYSFNDWINFYLNMCVTDFIAYRKPYISADDHDCSFYLFVFLHCDLFYTFSHYVKSNTSIDRLWSIRIDDMTNSSGCVSLAMYLLRSPCLYLFLFKNRWKMRRTTAMLCLKLAYRKRCLIACVFA